MHIVVDTHVACLLSSANHSQALSTPAVIVAVHNVRANTLSSTPETKFQLFLVKPPIRDCELKQHMMAH